MAAAAEAAASRHIDKVEHGDRAAAGGIDHAAAVGADGGRAAHKEIADAAKRTGAETLAKNGFADADHLLAGLKGNVTTGFDGKACPVQPKGNEVSTQLLGEKGNGCDLVDDAKLKSKFDQAASHTARVNVTREGEKDSADHHGSGVIVGKGDGVCIGVTDHHVPHGDDGSKNLDHMSVKMPNGKTYPARLGAENPGKDISTFVAQTGADTEAVCKPATVAPPGRNGANSPGNDNLGVGYPMHSQSPRAIPGRAEDTRPASQQNVIPLQGENMQRPLIREDGKYLPGGSGGGIWNGKGQVTGLMDRSNNVSGLVTPIDRPEVDDLVRRSK